jgi:glycerophosphoryl diester phosphodiesterase
MASVRPLVLGHRGSPRRFAENTIGSFEAAFEGGADGVEFDVRNSADGVPLVFHDADLLRMARRPERIAELTARQLAAVELLGGARIPTLAEALDVVRSAGRLVNVEIKPGVDPQPALAVLRQCDANAWAFPGSFDEAIVRACAGSGEWRSFLIAEGPRRPLLGPQRWARRFAVKAQALGAAGISLNAKCSGALAGAALWPSCGLAAWFWTVNDSELAARLGAAGADAIITDLPDCLQNQLSNQRGPDPTPSRDG